MTIGQFVFAVSLVLLAFAHNLPVAVVLIGINRLGHRRPIS